MNLTVAVPETDIIDGEPETDIDCYKDLVELDGYTASESIDVTQ